MGLWGSRVRSPPVPVVLSLYQRGSLLDGIAMYLSCDTKKFHDSESTHTHPFNGPLSETTWVSRYQKGKNQSGFY